MNDCKKCHNLFAEAIYGELNTEQKDFFEDHLHICLKCKSEFAETKSTFEIMNKRIRPEPGQAFWDNYWKRLAKRMDKEEVLQPKPESWWRTLVQPLTHPPKWAYQLAAALLLVVIGIFIGRMMNSPTAPDVQQVQQTHPMLVSQAEPGAEVIHRAQNYIERSKLILLAIINFDPETEDPYALNLPYQQQVSRELVQEASFLKKELVDTKQRRLQNLVTDLEVILLQIANLESEYDFEAIDIVKKGVDSRGILMKINLSDIRKSIKKENKAMPHNRASNKI